MPPSKSMLGMLAAALVTACGGSGDAVPMVNPAVLAAQPALSNTPMDTIVTTRLLPILDTLFEQVHAQGLNTEMQGIKVFAPDSGDKFLPGKVAIGFSYLLLNSQPGDPRHQVYLDGYRAIADMTLNVTNETWGIYYYLSALWKLKQAGYLDGANPAINADTLAALQTKLDWRNFVDAADYSLKGTLPTNYYGVAFSVARLRYLLGWEGPQASEALLQKTINHYKTFSAFGFSDETDGSGRFDRYSVLLIGEIMQRINETNMEVNPDDLAALKGWLRQSVDLIKLNLNPAGNGFSYGRSLSAYGDTAFAEVLSAAEHFDVLTPEEKDIAYAFATRVTAKYVDFWYDADAKSLNMWDKGRRTDSYRGKARILGENLSLAHQLIYTNNLWKADGYAQKAPMPTLHFVQYLQALPRATLTRFAGFDDQPTTYDRGLVTYRDGLRVISLPVVNGAATYHRTNPYFTIPYSYNMLSGVADTQWPQLQPRFTLTQDGTSTRLIAAAYQKNLRISPSADGKQLSVSFTQDALDSTQASAPKPDDRLRSSTQYLFEPGQITRIDTYTPTHSPLNIDKIEMEFGTYSTGVTAQGNAFSYAWGDVYAFEVQGLQTCAATDVSNNTDYNTPSGALQTSILCTSPAMTLNQPLTIKWVLKYRSPSVATYAPR